MGADDELVARLRSSASRASRGMTIWFFEDSVASAMLYIIAKSKAEMSTHTYRSHSSNSIPRSVFSSRYFTITGV